MNKTILAALLAASCASALASEFYVVVPVKNRTATAGNIAVALNGAALPAGVVGRAYPGVDFASMLQVKGDPNFSAAGVRWAVAGGTLPDGLSLSSSGKLSGTPTTPSESAFQVLATYKTKSGQQAYTILVGAISISLAQIAPPAGVVGMAYQSLDLKPSLTVQGDDTYIGAGVAWSVEGGALPLGLTLEPAAGVISGTPRARGAAALQVKALYKGKSAVQSITIPVSEGIAQNGSSRAWSDGTLATSCSGYRSGKLGYTYAGATGDGVYRIDVDGAGPLAPVDALCDMTTDGGGWTVIQNRHNGAVDFYRTYAEYAAGFGSAATEYWLGNDRIAALTAGGARIRVDMVRTNGQSAYALYSTFKLNPASDKYRLAVSGYSGTAGDSFSTVGMQFSAKDSDNDSYGGNCAVEFHGAWWYSDCHSSNLNGAYLNGPHESFADGIDWYTVTGHYESLKSVSMKVREN
jgi:hypothetical protein